MKQTFDTFFNAKRWAAVALENANSLTLESAAKRLASVWNTAICGNIPSMVLLDGLFLCKEDSAKIYQWTVGALGCVLNEEQNGWCFESKTLVLPQKPGPDYIVEDISSGAIIVAESFSRPGGVEIVLSKPESDVSSSQFYYEWIAQDFRQTFARRSTPKNIREMVMQARNEKYMFLGNALFLMESLFKQWGFDEKCEINIDATKVFKQLFSASDARDLRNSLERVDQVLESFSTAMPMLNETAQFATMVESGRKRKFCDCISQVVRDAARKCAERLDANDNFVVQEASWFAAECVKLLGR